MTDPAIAALTDFFLELDLLKQVERRSYIRGGSRLENSAEHSWHLAMACWAVAEYFKVPVSLESVLKMALVHDLGEIDAGDSFLYGAARAQANVAERQCVTRLAAQPGNPINELLSCWDAQETGTDEAARLVKTVDRLLPLLLNVANEGRTWREHGIKRSQVTSAHAFIADTYPAIHVWIEFQINAAVAAGWLLPD